MSQLGVSLTPLLSHPPPLPPLFNFNSRFKAKHLSHHTIQKNRCYFNNPPQMAPYNHLLWTFAILHSPLLPEYQYHYSHLPIHPLKKNVGEKGGEKSLAGKKSIRLLRIQFLNYFSPLPHAINSFESTDKFIILNTKDIPGSGGNRQREEELRVV